MMPTQKSTNETAGKHKTEKPIKHIVVAICMHIIQAQAHINVIIIIIMMTFDRNHDVRNMVQNN
jgi:hypothetical protein